MRAKFRLSRYFRRTRQPVLFDVMGTPRSTAFSSSERVFRQLGGNAGNLAFVHAIKRHLIGLSARANVDWRSTPEQINKAGDVCVIPCANQFGPHYDFGGLAKRLEKISTSFVAIGLGTQSSLAMRIPEVPEGTVRWLRRITELAPSRMANVGVRGESSRRVLEAYGFHETCVIGCPSLFLNPSTTLGRLISERTVDGPRHVAVAAGTPGLATSVPHRAVAVANRHRNERRIRMPESVRVRKDGPGRNRPTNAHGVRKMSPIHRSRLVA